MIPPASLSAFLARTDVSPEMREFFAKRGVEPAEVPAQEADKPIVDTAPEPEISDDEDDEKSAMQRLSEMNVPQKMARATKGHSRRAGDPDPRSEQVDRGRGAEQSKVDRLGGGVDREDVQCVR